MELPLASLRAAAFWRRKVFWQIVAAVLVLIAGLVLLSVRSHRKTEAMNALNSFEPFASPPLEMNFPAVVADIESNHAVLDIGGREGIWKIFPRSSGRAMEIRLTDQGMRWFSIVGDQVVATVKAGTRQVTRIDQMDGTFPSRHVTFRFVWNELHPADVLLGSDGPARGREYSGEALLYYEGGQWHVLHWSTSNFDLAVARFKTLLTAVHP